MVANAIVELQQCESHPPHLDYCQQARDLLSIKGPRQKRPNAVAQAAYQWVSFISEEGLRRSETHSLVTYIKASLYPAAQRFQDLKFHPRASHSKIGFALLCS